jgi:hypothetical protein
MVVINSVTPATVQQTKKLNKKRGVKPDKDKGEASQPSQLARAVSHSIRHADEADIERARVQYDLPEGHSRKAMQEYMHVFNQARRDELSQLVGVDLYI